MKIFLLSLAISTMLASAGIRAQEIVAEHVLRSTTSWDGATLPAYATGQPEITILKFTIPAGASLDTHKHSKWHYGQNKGTEPAVIMVFYAGIKDKEFTHAKPLNTH